MIRLKHKQIAQYRKTITFINPKCGHEQTFEYNVPFVCQAPDCKEKIANVDRLIGEINLDRRIKYFVEGVV